jgi:hypothetical protein
MRAVVLTYANLLAMADLIRRSVTIGLLSSLSSMVSNDIVVVVVVSMLLRLWRLLLGGLLLRGVPGFKKAIPLREDAATCAPPPWDLKTTVACIWRLSFFLSISVYRPYLSESVQTHTHYTLTSFDRYLNLPYVVCKDRVLGRGIAHPVLMIDYSFFSGQSVIRRGFLRCMRGVALQIVERASITRDINDQ